ERGRPRAGPGGGPDVQRGGEPGAAAAPVAGLGARGRRAGRRRRQPGRHRRHRRPDGRRRRQRARPAPLGEGRPGRRVRRRVPLGAGRGLRRRRRDGRRRVARPGGAAPAAHRDARRRPGHRLPVGAGRAGPQLAGAPAAALPRREHLHPGAAALPHQGRHRGVPGVPAGGAGGAEARRGRLDRLLLPDRPRLEDLAGRLPGRRGADHVHRAGGRHVEDEPVDRHRGAVAGRGVGADLPQPGCPGAGAGREEL
ncbi:MAG: Undecaprenyl-phosphate mannosyltransferase, partial [uncultured Corynebacteriales bacterium]